MRPVSQQCPKHPSYVLLHCPECASPSHRPGAVRYVENETIKPAHRLGVSFIAEVPNGAKLMVFNEQIFVVAPGMAPCFVTPTGLVPVKLADGSDLK